METNQDFRGWCTLNDGFQKILIVTSNFTPEKSGIAVYSQDLANTMSLEGHKVTVLTGLPFYPWWRVPKEFENIMPGKSLFGKVEVIRFSPHIPKKGSALGRALFEFSFWSRGKKMLRKITLSDYDLVVAIMPTVSSGLLARRVSQKIRIPGVVIFQDISSLGALESGISGGKLLYGFAKFLEIRSSKWASRIIVVSEAMIPVVSLFTKGKTPISLVHNYSILKPSTLSRSEARASLNFDKDSFLLLHTGNIGHKQDLLNVVEAAKLIKDHSDIKFLFVGHGNQEEKIRLAIAECQNIEMRTFFNAADFPKALVSANILLINEIPTLREMALPSKLTAYLSSGSPVLAAVSPEGATSKFLGGAAFKIQPGNPRALAEAILMLKDDATLREQLTKNAKIFSEEYLSSSAGRKKYLTLFKSIQTKG